MSEDTPIVTTEPLPDTFQVHDLLELVRKGTHYTKRANGYVYIIEAVTGNTLALLDSPHKIPTRIIKKDGIWVEEGIANEVIPARTLLVYTPLIVDEICRRITEGEALTKICGTQNMPSYNDFCRWRREHPWITEALEKAREDRAEKLRDEAIEEADKATSAKDAPAQQLKADIRKWAAGVDSARYNPKTKVEATFNVPTQIIVQTGIVRDVTPGMQEHSEGSSRVGSPQPVSIPERNGS